MLPQRPTKEKEGKSPNRNESGLSTSNLAVVCHSANAAAALEALSAAREPSMSLWWRKGSRSDTPVVAIDDGITSKALYKCI